MLRKFCWGFGPSIQMDCASAVSPTAMESRGGMETSAQIRGVFRVLNGGIIGTLLDCHCNWTAAYHFIRAAKTDSCAVPVTPEYAIKLRRPTPRTIPCFFR